MWTNAHIQQAVVDHPQQANDALLAIQINAPGKPLSAAGLQAAADMLDRDIGEFWVEQLDARQLLESFAHALVAQGVAIDLGPVDLAATNIDADKLSAFTTRAQSFRCRIKKNGLVAGSGTLIGPTTVLTAWHVIASAAPGKPQEPWPKIEVELADGLKVPAHLPAEFYQPCSPEEFESLLPANDQELANSADVAVLRLARPAGALLGVATLPGTPARYTPNATVLVVHYPNGVNSGIGVGAISKIRQLTARWAHTVGARPGSSGGGCFDSSLTLAGIHQAKDGKGQGRLVPTAQFLEHVRAVVTKDEAPPRMWSLDGTAEGEFVIGRQAFFTSFAAARGDGRVRGIRVKRSDAAADLSGLPFSFRMLERMLARSAATRLCRLSFETLVPDLADEIARRASDTGIPIDPLAAAPGVAAGESAPEAVGADRGRRVAIATSQQAEKLDIQLWFSIDHPAIAFGDEARAVLEAFIDQAMLLPRLRLLIAGFEAVALPGLEFENPPTPGEQGPPGLMTEILTGFAASDVRLFLTDAAAAANKILSNERLEELIAIGLEDLEEINGIYSPWQARDAGEKLRPDVRKFF
jgi:hypothetical protein